MLLAHEPLLLRSPSVQKMVDFKSWVGYNICVCCQRLLKGEHLDDAGLEGVLRDRLKMGRSHEPKEGCTVTFGFSA